VETVAVETVAVETGAAATVVAATVVAVTVVVAPLRVVAVPRAGVEGFEEDAAIVSSAPTRSCRLTTSSSTCSKSLSAKEAK
jgi:hypothetical protein